MILESIPSEFIAGDTWRWTRAFADYPAGTWTVTYGSQIFSIAGVANGTAHDFVIAASATAAYKPGRYFWSARAVNGSIVETIAGESGWLEVKPDPSTGTHDMRSQTRRTLDAVSAFLEGNASTAQASMSLGGRSLSRWSLAELQQWEDRLRERVRIEEAGARAGLGRNIKVRFGRA